MDKKRIIINNIIILIEGVLACIFLILTPSLKTSIESVHIHILFFGILTLLVLNISDILKTNKNITIVIVFMDVIVLLISILKNNGGFGSLEFFLSILLIILIGDSINIKKGTIKFIGVISTLCFILVILRKMDGINTNVASYHTFILYILMLTFAYSHIKNSKIKFIILMICTILMISNALYYDCRTVLVGTIFIFLANMVPVKIWKLNIIKKGLFFILTIGSLLVVAGYLYLYNNGMDIDMSDFSNKDLYSGRETIWTYMLNEFKNGKLLLGIGSDFSQYGLPNQGIHNYMLNVLVIFGSINFAAFLYVFYLFIVKMFDIKIMDKNNITYISAISSIFLIEYFETHLISAYSLAALMLLIVFYYNENRLKIETGE